LSMVKPVENSISSDRGNEEIKTRIAV